MSERLDDESMRITRLLLAIVRKELAAGVNPEDSEPDEHKAVRVVEEEADRARKAEVTLREAMARAIRESGCDGDLCAHRWHEEFRALGIRP